MLALYLGNRKWNCEEFTQINQNGGLAVAVRHVGFWTDVICTDKAIV